MKDKVRAVVVIVVLLLSLELVPFTRIAAQSLQSSEALLPDLRTVVPSQLYVRNIGGRALLRFSNGLANTGDGPWHIRPEHDGDITHSIQVFFDKDKNVVTERYVGSYEFHPEHDHWHIADIALYEIRDGSLDGATVGINTAKISYCLFDTYRLADYEAKYRKTYYRSNCKRGIQGISVGWVDLYDHTLPGQEISLTGLPEGRYYLVSTVDPDGMFVEKDPSNNTAWVEFYLRIQNNKVKIDIMSNSACDLASLCGEKPRPNKT